MSAKFKELTLSISEVIATLNKLQAEGQTEIKLSGYIAAETNRSYRWLYLSDSKDKFLQSSDADDMIDRMFSF